MFQNFNQTKYPIRVLGSSDFLIFSVDSFLFSGLQGYKTLNFRVFNINTEKKLSEPNFKDGYKISLSQLNYSNLRPQYYTLEQITIIFYYKNRYQLFDILPIEYKGYFFQLCLLIIALHFQNNKQYAIILSRTISILIIRKKELQTSYDQLTQSVYFFYQRHYFIFKELRDIYSIMKFCNKSENTMRLDRSKNQLAEQYNLYMTVKASSQNPDIIAKSL
ncbi:hypothetical protein pb186bvf_020952 [Paramecium bursaria]